MILGRKFRVAVSYETWFFSGQESGTYVTTVRARGVSGATRKALHRFVDEVELGDRTVLELRVDETDSVEQSAHASMFVLGEVRV